MAQRPINTNTQIIDNEQELIKLFYTPGLKVKDLTIVSNDKLIVVTELAEELVTESKFSNKVIAAFVTAYGRCLLFKAASKLKKNLLYMDTGWLKYIYNACERIC